MSNPQLRSEGLFMLLWDRLMQFGEAIAHRVFVFGVGVALGVAIALTWGIEGAIASPDIGSPGMETAPIQLSSQPQAPDDSIASPPRSSGQPVSSEPPASSEPPVSSEPPTVPQAPSPEEKAKPLKTYLLNLLPDHPRQQVTLDPPATRLQVIVNRGTDSVRCGDGTKIYTCALGKPLIIDRSMDEPITEFWAQNSGGGDAHLRINVYE